MGNKILIITDNHKLQDVSYWELMDAGYDSIGYEMQYLLPRSESFTFFLHHNKHHLIAARGSYPFKYFCEQFNGTHVFSGCEQNDIDKLIDQFNIKKFIIHSPASHPKTLHASVLPFVIESNYTAIVMVGMASNDKRKFHMVAYIQPHLNKLSDDDDIDEWKKWAKIAQEKNINIVSIPKNATNGVIETSDLGSLF